jgi:hypothetical protein
MSPAASRITNGSTAFGLRLQRCLHIGSACSGDGTWVYQSWSTAAFQRRAGRHVLPSAAAAAHVLAAQGGTVFQAAWFIVQPCRLGARWAQWST